MDTELTHAAKFNRPAPTGMIRSIPSICSIQQTRALEHDVDVELNEL